MIILAKSCSYIDFRCIEKITTSAALILAAEFDRRHRVTNLPLFPVLVAEWDESVRNTLNDVGFLELLGFFEECSEIKSNPSIVIQKFITGRDISTDRSDSIIVAVNELSKSGFPG